MCGEVDLRKAGKGHVLQDERRGSDQVLDQEERGAVHAPEERIGLRGLPLELLRRMHGDGLHRRPHTDSRPHGDSDTGTYGDTGTDRHPDTSSSDADPDSALRLCGEGIPLACGGPAPVTLRSD